MAIFFGFFNVRIILDGGGVGSFHSGSRQYATLNLPEHSSATTSFLRMLSISLPVLVAFTFATN
jgi:hypothetical protein